MRFILIFVALAALAFGGWWVWGSRAVDARLAELTEELRAAGWRVEYQTDGTGGFPYRFDLDLRDLELVSPDGTFGWQSPRMRLVAQSYQPGRLILAADETHRVSIPGQDLDITVTGPRASGAVEIGETLPVTEFTAEAADLRIVSSLGWESGVERLLAALRPNGAARGYDAYARLDGVALPASWGLGTALPAEIDRAVIDADLTFGTPLALSGAPATLEQVAVDSLAVEWDAVSVEGDGTLSVDAQGFPVGELVLRITGWELLLDLAARAGVPIAESSLLRGALGGMADDGVLTAPIGFADGQMRLGFIPLGEAPRLR
ncbi:DUF2125 domain-containing protein [Limimaricola litoreus]|uniref:DUF2125 domain-containing protein n=1 Tax=Limimaricola litoreus TaxID=2955316 RepID=A0A9X2JQX3_9RHOB|nr:DUF2125 domain-containing protein [Limimaricola litoreus]MCP1169815.1 DUF2125 domain-containing protein [Limimaricola litoreus]